MKLEVSKVLEDIPIRLPAMEPYCRTDIYSRFLLGLERLERQELKSPTVKLS